MASPPSSTKQMSRMELLTRLVTSAMLCLFLYWQFVAPHTAALPSEITDADQALRTNNLKLARRRFDSLIARAPQDPDVFLLIMTECNTASRFDLSMEYGLRGLDACKYAPNAVRAALYLQISMLFTASHEPAPQINAQRFARRALELAPDDPNTLNGYGYVAADNAQTQQDVNIGLGYIQKALLILRAQAKTDYAALSGVEDSEGWALYRRGRYDARDFARAVDALNQAIDDMPESMPKETQKIMYYHLGAAYHAASRIEDARYALQVALFFDPRYADALKELAALPHEMTPPPTSVPSVVRTADGKPVFQPLDKPPVGVPTGTH